VPAPLSYGYYICRPLPDDLDTEFLFFTGPAPTQLSPLLPPPLPLFFPWEITSTPPQALSPFLGPVFLFPNNNDANCGSYICSYVYCHTHCDVRSFSFSLLLPSLQTNNWLHSTVPGFYNPYAFTAPSGPHHFTRQLSCFVHGLQVDALMESIM